MTSKLDERPRPVHPPLPIVALVVVLIGWTTFFIGCIVAVVVTQL